MNKLRLLISQACRSDYPVSDPIIKRLKQEDWCDVQVIYLIPADFEESYIKCMTLFENFQYDLVICVGDRIEILSLAIASFFSHQKIAHLGAGITNSISTYDDLIRHQITILSDIALCEDITSYNTTVDLWYNIRKKGCKAHIVGNAYEIDDIDESLVPDEPYDLVLVNKETLNEKKFKLIYQDHFTIRIGENPDGKTYDSWENKGNLPFIDYDNLPRPQFLGLLKNCHRFITNSSSAFYEAMPLGLKREQIILVGERNRGRSSPMEWNQDYKSSEKICSIIKKWWEDKQK